MHYPFRERYSITNRSYSFYLQRAIADFGSGCSFSETQNKIEEHYRIKVPESSIRCVVLAHAQQMDSYLSSLNPQEGVDSRRAPEVVVGQTDGTMIPIVKTRSSSFFCLTFQGIYKPLNKKIGNPLETAINLHFCNF